MYPFRQQETVSLLAVFFCPESKEARRAKVLPYPCENFFPILCEKSCPSLARKFRPSLVKKSKSIILFAKQ